MKIKDLRSGDILLFSDESESPISDLITFLTKSSLSHAAIVYNDSSEIVEETPPAIHLHSVKKRCNGGRVSVMRHYPMKESYGPVLDIARNYLNYNQPYPSGKLYALGLLLLYRKFTPSINTQKVMVKIFKKIESDLLDYVDRFIYPGKFPVYCSQFVYRCYEEAGDEYRLGLDAKNSCVEESESAGGKSLLRQVIHRIRNDTSDEFSSYISQYSDRDLGIDITGSDIELATDLVNAWQSEPDLKQKSLDNELVVAIHGFGQAVYQAMTGINIDYHELEHANRIGMTTSGLSLLCLEEEDFITPGDLLNNCVNLRHVGEIGVL